MWKKFTRLALGIAMVLSVGSIAVPTASARTVTMRPAWTSTEIACSCVIYVRNRTGLTGGVGAAADYTEAVMWSKGYRRVLPTAGAILVWDRNQKGAWGDGHMALVRSARYDGSLRQWVVSVDHANWGNTRCTIRTSTFYWGNLYGVNAYVRR